MASKKYRLEKGVQGLLQSVTKLEKIVVKKIPDKRKTKTLRCLAQKSRIYLAS